MEVLTDLHNAYKMAERTNGKPPQSVEEIQTHLKARKTEDVLVSPNDKEPFVILWGTKVELSPQEMMELSKKSGKGPMTFPIFAYEQKGSGGKRYVLYIMGEAKQLTDEEFKKATFAGKHKPQF